MSGASSNGASKKRVTLREESLAENKDLGLEDIQEQMDFIFAILHEHGINSRLWLSEYMTHCEKTGSDAPPNLSKFLPWNLSAAVKQRLSKESFFSYGKAQFVQANDGTVYHLRKNGSREAIKIGDLTAEEFDALTATG